MPYEIEAAREMAHQTGSVIASPRTECTPNPLREIRLR